MALILWYSSGGQSVRELARSVLMDHSLELRFHESLNYPTATPSDTVLVLGDQVKNVIALKGLIPKNRTTSSLREQVFTHEQLPRFMLTYSPTIREIDYAKGVDVVCDFQLAKRVAMTGSTAPQLGKYSYPDDLKQFKSEVEALFEQTGKPVPVAVDLETLGVNPFDPNAYILNISVSHTERTATALSFTQYTQPTPTDSASPDGLLWSDIHWLLNSPQVSIRGANLKFDLVWMAEKWQMTCTNFKFDTLLVGSLLDENRSNSLKVHAKVMTDLGAYSDTFDRQFDKGRMDLIPVEARREYAAADADATIRVAQVEQKLLQQNSMLTRFYVKILHPAARAFEKVERCGVFVDREAYTMLQAELENALEVLEHKALSCMGRRLLAKWGDQAKLSKSKFLADYMFSPTGLNLTPRMFTAKTQAPSTSMDHFEMFDDDERAKPFVKALKEYNSASKTLSTFVIGFLKHLRPDDRFHATYFLANQGDIGGTNCMPAGELVLTSRGYLPVEKVEVGDYVITHEGRVRAVEEFICNGFKPILQVQTSTGLFLRTTANHQYLTLRGWVSAGRLVIGDEVLTHSEVEQWEVIPEFPEFSVSSWGRVRNDSTARLATQLPKGEWGHLKVCLYRNGAQKRGADRRDFPVHRLVANAFVPNPENHPEVRHLNGIAWDNTVGNLAWGTCKDNRLDAVAHGTMSRRNGSQNKLTEESVQWIRSLPLAKPGDGGWTNKKLAEHLGVCERLIRAVRNGQRWLDKNPPGSVVEFSHASVTSITPLREARTYGLTVEEDHSHVTGGIVTHNTGRLSAKDPAFQTLPKHSAWAKKLRKCFVAPPGFVMLGPDYSQGELKIAACLANEPTMIDAYSKGIDLHAVTAAGLAGFKLDEFMELKEADSDKYDEIRQLGKAGNFGLIYGMGAGGFKTYAELNYGVAMTMEEAEQARNKFFQTYPVLLEWHKECKGYARRHKQIHSPLGRVRHLPLINTPIREVAAKAERQSVNSPVQSTLSDMSMWATAIMDREYGMDINGFCVIGMIHDQLLAYAPEDEAELWAGRLKEVMENLPFEEVNWNPQLKFTTDMAIGRSLADLKKWAKPGDWQP